MNTCALKFTHASTLPDTAPGTMVTCIILTKAATGRDWTMPAYYLNAYPLEYEDCVCNSHEDHGENDGCPTTGWFYDESNFDYENCYHPVTGTVVAWAKIPSAEDVIASLPVQP